MFAKANVSSPNSSPELELEHLGERLYFSISVFGRDSFRKEHDVFKEINEYWAYLPIDKQTAIFNIYKEIHQVYDSLVKIDLSDYIATKVAELVSYHDLQMMYDWMMFKSEIVISNDFEVHFKADIDKNTSREKTYIQHDYVQLVTLSLSLRCMIPVWGEYIANTRREKGTFFKEYYSFQLLNKTPLIRSIPMEKLRVYIDHIVGSDKFKPDNTLRSISSEDFIYWLLALICVRKLCVGDIRGTDPASHLVKSVFKFIKQKLQNNDSNFSNTYKEKKLDEKSGNQENKISSLENYKIKTTLSPGEIVELETSLERDLSQSLHRLSSRMNAQDLQNSIMTSRALINERILDPQMTLLGWIIKPIVTPHGLWYPPKDMLVKALGAAEATLWARGHHYLAILVTSHLVISDRDMMISPVDSKIRVAKELTDRLERLYPYTKPLSGKKTQTAKKVTLITESIDLLVDNLTMFSWKSTASDDKLKYVFGTNSKRLPIRPDIKTLLTELVIELGERSYL